MTEIFLFVLAISFGLTFRKAAADVRFLSLVSSSSFSLPLFPSYFLRCQNIASYVAAAADLIYSIQQQQPREIESGFLARSFWRLESFCCTFTLGAAAAAAERRSRKEAKRLSIASSSCGLMLLEKDFRRRCMLVVYLICRPDAARSLSLSPDHLSRLLA
jgi:hypothetical protein